MMALSTTLRNRLILPCGALVALLGLIVMLGWWLGVETLVQVHPSLVPMQFNTALGLFMTGAGLWATASRKASAAVLLGAALAVLGGASVSQYMLGINLGIDQLFLRSYITVATSHPGRMAPNTALCFLMAGSAMLLLAPGSPARARRFIAELLGAMITGIALTGLLGYGLDVTAAYGWGAMTHMAVHTAAGFLVIASALFIAAWLPGEDEASYSPNWLAIPIGVAGLAMLFGLSQALAKHEWRQIGERVQAETRFVRTVFRHHVDTHVLALERLVSRWEPDGAITDESFATDAVRYIGDYRDYVAIGLADDGGAVLAQLSEVQFPRPETLGELSPMFLLSERPANNQDGIIVSPLTGATESNGSIVAVIPVDLGGKRSGYLYGVLSLRGMLPPLAPSLPDFGLAVRNSAVSVFETGGPPPGDERWLHEVQFLAFETVWNIAVWPTEKGLATLRSPVLRPVLRGGVMVVILLLIAVHVAQLAARRARKFRSVNRTLNKAQAELERLAMFDSLTGLGNRNFFIRQLDLSLTGAARARQSICLLVLDLNGFKEVNDTLGHKAGDSVLRSVAERLSDSLRSSDQVFRLGGDEFAVLLTAGTDLSGALVLAGKLHASLAAPVVVDGTPQAIGASIGAAAYPQHGASAERLLREADVAMYQAKKSGVQVAVPTELGATMTMQSLDDDKLAGIAERKALVKQLADSA